MGWLGTYRRDRDVMAQPLKSRCLFELCRTGGSLGRSSRLCDRLRCSRGDGRGGLLSKPYSKDKPPSLP
jgi:hypothetical protein